MSGQAGAVTEREGEIVVTPEMVEAGWRVATDADVDIFDPNDFFESVFKAMMCAYRQTQPHS